jgi:hypothetical protein
LRAAKQCPQHEQGERDGGIVGHCRYPRGRSVTPARPSRKQISGAPLHLCAGLLPLQIGKITDWGRPAGHSPARR